MKKYTNHRTTRPILSFALVLGLTALPLTTIVVSQEAPEPSPDPVKSKPESITAESIPHSDKPVCWEVIKFQLVNGDSDEVERKVAKIVQQYASANLQVIREQLDKNGFRQYNMSRTVSGELPARLKAEADALKFGHTARPVRNGSTYLLARKTVDKTNSKKGRMKQIADRQAKLELKAQRRLLQLDLEEAEIELLKAVAIVERAHKGMKRLGKSPSQLIDAPAKLAQIKVERAKIAIELFDAKHPSP